MNNRIKAALTEGLLMGYAGEVLPQEVNRAGFVGQQSEIKKDDFHYHDEWFVGNVSGGGQELIEINGEKFTRIYAGATPSEEKLIELNLNAEQVWNYLIEKIKELGNKTRLDENCQIENDEWRYEYKVMLQELGTVVGYERIFYQDVEVHLHVFTLCAVR